MAKRQRQGQSEDPPAPPTDPLPEHPPALPVPPPVPDPPTDRPPFEEALRALAAESRRLAGEVKEAQAVAAEHADVRNRYAAAARVIGLHLRDFCDESLPYDEMIAEASRRVAGEVAQLQQEATKFTDAMTQSARQIRSLERTIVTIQTNMNTQCSLCASLRAQLLASDMRLTAAEGEVARLREQVQEA